MQGPGFYHSHIVYRSRSSGFASVTLSGRMERMGKWDVNWNWIHDIVPNLVGLCFHILSLLHWAFASEPSKFCGKRKLTISWKSLIKLIGPNSYFCMWYQSKEDIPPLTRTSSFLSSTLLSSPGRFLTPHKFTPEFERHWKRKVFSQSP